MVSSTAKSMMMINDSLHVADTMTQRFLADGDYMEDDEGNRYATYSVSWRYLGMYIDCDNVVNRRRLKNNENNKNNICPRKVMWAAYYDPDYEGYSIGEYKFYEWTTDSWDNSTCQTDRCAPMDCHLPDTRYQLLGIYTETDGLEDWAEQLFKHQGYCLWDGDKDGGNDDDSDYVFMQNQRQTWSRDCEKGDVSDANGNTLYMGVKPLPYGRMTFSVYTDNSCSSQADMTITEYMMNYYTNNKKYSSSEAEDAVADYLDSIDRWNNLMHDYRTCQPCRAYNKVQMQRRRVLNNDGEGDNEMWGYDCYDDAGYTNCNQCYKFGTKTDMAAATVDDLRRATLQGSIMPIELNGTMYGGYVEPFDFKSFNFSTPQMIYLIVAFVFGWAILFAVAMLMYKCFVRCCCKPPAPVSLKERLNENGTKMAKSLMGAILKDKSSDNGSKKAKNPPKTTEYNKRNRETEPSGYQLGMKSVKHDLMHQKLWKRVKAGWPSWMKRKDGHQRNGSWPWSTPNS